MQGLKDYHLRFTSYEFFNGLLVKFINKRSAWGVMAAVCCNSSSPVSIFFLQFIKLS